MYTILSQIQSFPVKTTLWFRKILNEYFPNHSSRITSTFIALSFYWSSCGLWASHTHHNDCLTERISIFVISYPTTMNDYTSEIRWIESPIHLSTNERISWYWYFLLGSNHVIVSWFWGNGNRLLHSFRSQKGLSSFNLNTFECVSLRHMSRYIYLFATYFLRGSFVLLERANPSPPHHLFECVKWQSDLG